ncbi:hypothetical protein [Petroclostridium sp. X23]|uniref:hypothetical protein n=1 Tax=Petroclostridium sp. X23 TaxID=3045146 RepID=UPI0024AD2923|nr:hypothetical protein [Petroclostridium sp. X23]WHH59488.1 hypothetical protein QKW49_01590 [Petroclostridium sp. X23]
MATVSFDKKIVINNNESMDVLLKSLNKEIDKSDHKKIDVVSELERSSSLLRRSFSRSKT